MLAAFLLAGWGAPGGLHAAELRLRWRHDGRDIGGFRIERASSTGSFERIASTGAGATSYTDTGLSASATYRYRVRAFNDVGESSPTSVVTATTPAADAGGSIELDLTSSDIGSPRLAGSSRVSNGTYTIKAGGDDIWEKYDEFRFAHDEVTGDAELVVRVANLEKSSDWAKAGLMLRASTGSDAPYVGIFITPEKGVRTQWRKEKRSRSMFVAGNNARAPQWLRLVRSGDRFTTYHSTNGSSWKKVHSVSFRLPRKLLGGLAVTSHNTRERTTAVFDGFKITGAASAGGRPSVNAGAPSMSTSGDAAATLNSSDIGSPTAAGSTSFDNGILRIQAGGADIWNNSDQFRFARRTLAGDGGITVRVSEIAKSHDWAKAGLMMRASVSATSAHVSVFATPGAGVVLQWREVDGGESLGSVSLPVQAPVWLRLMRTGDTFYAFHSADGHEWDLVEFVELKLPRSILAGVDVTSHNQDEGTAALFHALIFE